MSEIQRIQKKIRFTCKIPLLGYSHCYILLCFLFIFLYILMYFINHLNIYICEFKYQIRILLYVHFYKLLFM